MAKQLFQMGTELSGDHVCNYRILLHKYNIWQSCGFPTHSGLHDESPTDATAHKATLRKLALVPSLSRRSRSVPWTILLWRVDLLCFIGVVLEFSEGSGIKLLIESANLKERQDSEDALKESSGCRSRRIHWRSPDEAAQERRILGAWRGHQET